MKLNFFSRLRIVLLNAIGRKVTYGEIAKANGEGPCQRCVGMQVSGQEANV